MSLPRRHPSWSLSYHSLARTTGRLLQIEEISELITQRGRPMSGTRATCTGGTSGGGDGAVGCFISAFAISDGRGREWKVGMGS